jgi:hypothetical protein
MVSFSEIAVDRHIQSRKVFLDTQQPHGDMHNYPNSESAGEM